MPDKIVSLEKRDAALQKDLERLLQIVPARYQGNGDLRQLIALPAENRMGSPPRAAISSASFGK